MPKATYFWWVKRKERPKKHELNALLEAELKLLKRYTITPGTTIVGGPEFTKEVLKMTRKKRKT